MSTKQIEVHAPASIANLGPGFDVFGVALNNLGDTIKIEATPGREISVHVEGVNASSIPTEVEANSAGAVVKHTVELHRIKRGFNIVIEKGVPSGKGLGSSGASAAAATLAMCQLLGLRLPCKQYVKLAAVGEAAVTGSPHADNVSASLLGGFTMVSPEYDVIRLEPPEVEIVIVVPEVYYENKTRLARSLLPEMVRLREAVLNVCNASRMAAAVALKDPLLFGSSICDNLVEPYRAKMIPNFWNVKRAALEAGASGCSIAGGGPSLFAVGENSTEIGRAMVDAFEDKGVRSDIYLTSPSSLGARVL